MSKFVKIKLNFVASDAMNWMSFCRENCGFRLKWFSYFVSKLCTFLFSKEFKFSHFCLSLAYTLSMLFVNNLSVTSASSGWRHRAQPKNWITFFNIVKMYWFLVTSNCFQLFHSYFQCTRALSIRWQWIQLLNYSTTCCCNSCFFTIFEHFFS